MPNKGTAPSFGHRGLRGPRLGSQGLGDSDRLDYQKRQEHCQVCVGAEMLRSGLREGLQGRCGLATVLAV